MTKVALVLPFLLASTIVGVNKWIAFSACVGFFTFVLLLYRVFVLVRVRFPFSWLWSCFLVWLAFAVCSALPSVRLILTAVA
jgi:hypothetical protein